MTNDGAQYVYNDQHIAIHFTQPYNNYRSISTYNSL